MLVYFLFTNAASRSAPRLLPVRVHVAQALIKAIGTISKINSMCFDKKNQVFSLAPMQRHSDSPTPEIAKNH
jgi:hypothetical protein